MSVYEFTASYHEIGEENDFLGFADEVTGRHFWVQRDEESEREMLPHAGDVWLEWEDQCCGGYGGIEEMNLSRERLVVRLTAERAKRMDGVEQLCVHLSLTGEEFAAVAAHLRRVFVGYEDLVQIGP